MSLCTLYYKFCLTPYIVHRHSPALLQSKQKSLSGAYTSCKMFKSKLASCNTLLLCLQVGTDVDVLAVKAARDNAELNAVSNRFTAVQCSSSIQVALAGSCFLLMSSHNCMGGMTAHTA